MCEANEPTAGEAGPNVKHLIDAVLDLAAKDTKLSDEAELVVLAAMEGAAALAEALGGNYPTRPPSPSDAAGPEGVATKPVGVYLDAIRVKGFRGIGPEVELELTSAPGHGRGRT